MITNNNGIEIFYTAFSEAAENEDVLDNSKFYYAIILLSKAIFHKEENPFEAMFARMLVDSSFNANNQLVGGRLPIIDEDTYEVLSEEAVFMYLGYMDQLRTLFITYFHTNHNAGKKIVTWREIEEKNHGMIARGFLKLCRKLFLIPHMFNIESLHEFIKATIPPMTNKEYDFFDKFLLVKEYESDQNFTSTSVEPLDGEPDLKFHEFIFCLGRIANITVSSGDTLTDKLTILFIEKLNFEKVEGEVKDIVLQNLEGGLDNREEGLYSDEDESSEGEPLDVEDPQRVLFDFLAKRAANEKDFSINYEVILNDLETKLP